MTGIDDIRQLGMRDAGLMTIRHTNLVGRYNDALHKLIGRRTSLAEFRIDATGFSPEVAEEIGDPDYMNPLGTNRRYILVHVGQKDLTVLCQRYTGARAMMRTFVEENREALFTLTSRDAVYGEFEDDTYKVRDVADLLSIRKVEFTVATPSGVVEKARRLAEMVERFPSSDTMWLDDATVSRMCELARAAGDVRHNPAVPTRTTFEKGNFHSSHLGGIYVFRHPERITLVYEEPGFSYPMRWQGVPLQAIPVTDTARLMDFLVSKDLVLVPNAESVLSRRETLLRKLEFLVVDHVSAADPSADLSAIGFEETKRLIYRHHDDLPQQFHEMARALKFASHGLEWDVSEIGPETLAYMTTAKPGPDRDLVNHLLAHLTPADYLGAYAANNPLFLERWDAWNESRRGYVLEFLKRRLSGRSAAMFEAVFGGSDAGLVDAETASLWNA